MSIEFTDLSLICRLCTFEFSECYLIEGELENLIYTLTSIKVSAINSNSILQNNQNKSYQLFL